MTAEENYRLLLEIQANRDFILQAYRQNPALLRHAETCIRLLFDMLEKEQDAVLSNPPMQTTPDQQR